MTQKRRKGLSATAFMASLSTAGRTTTPPRTLEIGSRVHYSGDMANASGWFTVTGKRVALRVTYNLREIDGDREFLGTHVDPDDAYHGHCAPRFVTGEAYDAWKSAMEGK